MTAAPVILSSSPSVAYLTRFAQTVTQEGEAIFRWWADHTQDAQNGGFYGEVDTDGQAVAQAPKGVILNTRLLWYFSEAALHFGPDLSLASEAAELAKRAYEAVAQAFADPVNGGLWWLLSADGTPLDSKKQGYAQAFGIYGLSAYYRLTRNENALALARTLTQLLETRFWDVEHGGYIEALSADWSAVADQRLSEKDADCPKTMNTHLHILEAYTGLYQAAPDTFSEAALRRIISVFLEKFVDADSGHLKLFFAMDWTDHTQAVSFGHDIEASWLLWEAAEVLRDEAIKAAAKPVALRLAEVTLAEGMHPDGGLMHERGFDGHLDPFAEWWGQAEAMVGFINAFQIEPRSDYFIAAEGLMAYLMREHKAGPEWSWYPQSSGREAPYLAGLWKCPYHNGRAMFELRNRLRRLLSDRPV